jgi:hypothetical protein
VDGRRDEGGGRRRFDVLRELLRVVHGVLFGLAYGSRTDWYLLVKGIISAGFYPSVVPRGRVELCRLRCLQPPSKSTLQHPCLPLRALEGPSLTRAALRERVTLGQSQAV